MVDIQSPNTEVRRGKKDRKKKEEEINQGKNTMACPIHRAAIASINRLFNHAMSNGMATC